MTKSDLNTHAIIQAHFDAVASLEELAALTPAGDPCYQLLRSVSQTVAATSGAMYVELTSALRDPMGVADTACA